MESKLPAPTKKHRDERLPLVVFLRRRRRASLRHVGHGGQHRQRLDIAMIVDRGDAAGDTGCRAFGATDYRGDSSVVLSNSRTESVSGAGDGVAVDSE